MLRSRFLWKLYAGYVALIALTALAVGLAYSGQIGETVEDNTRAQLRHHAQLLRELARTPLIEGNDNAGFADQVTRLGHAIGTRLTVIADDGRVLADSFEDPRSMDNHGSQPEILGARDTDRAATAERFSATVGEPMLYLALPVRTEGHRTGFVRVAAVRADLSQRISEVRRRMAIGVLLVAVLGSLLGLWFARRITRRLRSVTIAAQTMATGDHTRRAEISGRDEISRLAVSFNQMADELADRLELLERERSEVQAILGSMVEGVIAVDRNQYVVSINVAARSLLEIGSLDVRNRPIWEVTRLKSVCDILDRVIEVEHEARADISLPAVGGDHCLELHATPLLDENQRVSGGVVVIHDITELRRLEQVRRDFVSNVSHELKTPLTAIHGYVETLIDNHLDAATRARFLAKISNHSHRLSALVNDLLALSRVESGSSSAEHSRLDLRQPILSSVDLLSTRAADKKLHLNLDLSDDEVPVIGDAEMLRQVIDNLLDNAMKYTPSGGTIALRLRRQAKTVTIEVEDSGVGIEPQHHQRLFERFYCVDSARSRELGGTGLGLSIVKHVALNHGGHVEVESTPGEGSTFRVELPSA